MAFFLETLLGGLLAGTLYSLVAIGFVLIYKACTSTACPLPWPCC